MNEHRRDLLICWVIIGFVIAFLGYPTITGFAVCIGSGAVIGFLIGLIKPHKGNSP